MYGDLDENLCTLLYGGTAESADGTDFISTYKSNATVECTLFAYNQDTNIKNSDLVFNISSFSYGDKYIYDSDNDTISENPDFYYGNILECDYDETVNINQSIIGNLIKKNITLKIKNEVTGIDVIDEALGIKRYTYKYSFKEFDISKTNNQYFEFSFVVRNVNESPNNEESQIYTIPKCRFVCIKSETDDITGITTVKLTDYSYKLKAEYESISLTDDLSIKYQLSHLNDSLTEITNKYPVEDTFWGNLINSDILAWHDENGVNKFPYLNDKNYSNKVSYKDAFDWYSEIVMSNYKINAFNQIEIMPCYESPNHYLGHVESDHTWYEPPIASAVSSKVFSRLNEIDNITFRNEPIMGQGSSAVITNNETFNPIVIVNNPIVDGSNGNSCRFSDNTTETDSDGDDKSDIFQTDRRLPSRMFNFIKAKNFKGNFINYEISTPVIPTFDVWDNINFKFISDDINVEESYLTTDFGEYLTSDNGVYLLDNSNENNSALIKSIITDIHISLGSSPKCVFKCNIPTNIDKKIEPDSRLGFNILKTAVTADRQIGEIKTEVEANKNEIDNTNTILTNYINTTQKILSQGGYNLVKNSVGFIPFNASNIDSGWILSSSPNANAVVVSHSVNNVYLESVSKYGIFLSQGFISQSVFSNLNAVVSISFKGYCDNSSTIGYVDFIIVDNDEHKDKSQLLTTTEQEYKFENIPLVNGDITVRINNSNSVGNVIVTDLLINYGGVALKWTPNSNEIMGINVVTDKNGITLYKIADNNETQYNVLSLRPDSIKISNTDNTDKYVFDVTDGQLSANMVTVTDRINQKPFLCMVVNNKLGWYYYGN